MFPVLSVDHSRSEAHEQLGSKAKFWFTDQDRRMLFKAEERGTGEDWAEKIACELCRLIGLPHVHYELASECDGARVLHPGVVCESCAPPPLDLVLGNELLFKRDPRYPAADVRQHKVHEHTVDAVVAVLREIDPPAQPWMAGVPTGILSALDVFVGYVMLDAWIANQDRHHENWAALRDADRLRLAPTYDHGAALARNITDAERKDRLTTRDRNRTLAHYAARAGSAFYAAVSDRKPLLTVQAFLAFADRAPDAARRWRDALRTATIPQVREIVDEVPPYRMSAITRDFTVELLTVNRRRLLEESPT